MIKKILGVGMILGVLFGSVTFGADQYSNDSKNCTTRTSSTQWFCNTTNGLQLYMKEKNISQETFNIKKAGFDGYVQDTRKGESYDFTSTQGIKNLQDMLGLNLKEMDGKLGNQTLDAFFADDRCSQITAARREYKNGCQDNYEKTENYSCCQPKKDEGKQSDLPTPQLTAPVAGIQTFQCTESVTIDENKDCFCGYHPEDQSCGICGVTFKSCGEGYTSTGEKVDDATNQCTWSCALESKIIPCGSAKCSSYARAGQGVGIGMNADCLVHGGCSLDVYKTLGIRANSATETRTSVLGFFQDTISAATFFIGTILTISFLRAGFKFVMAGANGKDPSEAKNGMKYAVIGFVLVMSAYAIIRFVQYLASTGG